MQGKVLHIVSSLGMGGAETWILRLVHYQNKNTNSLQNIEILVASGQEGVLDSEFKSLGTRIHYLNLDKKHIFNFIIKYRALLKANKYDAVHNHQDLISGWYLLFGLGVNPENKVVHFHNPFYQLKENYRLNFRRHLIVTFGRNLLKVLATQIWGTSAQLLKEYGIRQEIFKKQIIIPIHCSFSIEEWDVNLQNSRKKIIQELGLNDKSKIVLFAGRFDKSLNIKHPQNHKNSALALHIFNKVPDDRVVMLMVGENKRIHKDFTALIKQLNLSNRVFLLGVRKDIKTLMAASDILLFPSRAEGLGMVAVEAQASGLPSLISSTVPKECLVIKELVTFKSTDHTIESWGCELYNIIKQGRKAGTYKDTRWKDNLFNIDYSVKQINKLYSLNKL